MDPKIFSEKTISQLPVMSKQLIELLQIEEENEQEQKTSQDEMKYEKRYSTIGVIREIGPIHLGEMNGSDCGSQIGLRIER